MKLKYNCMILVSAIMWGSGYVAVKIALEQGMHPFIISAIRFLIASIILAIIIRKKLPTISSDTYQKGIILGILLFIALSLQNIALQYTTVTNNAFITSTYVVFVPFLHWLIYKNRPKIFHLISVVISIIGIRLLHNTITNTLNIGDFLTFLCAIVFAIHIILLGNYAKHHNPMVLTFLQLATVSLLSWLSAFAFEPIPQINLTGIIAILYLGIFCSFIALLFQSIAQRHISQINASFIIATESFFGTFFSILILKESLTGKIIFGGSLVFIAIIIAEINLKPLSKSQKKSL